MANLALNVTVKWKVLIAFLSIVALAVLFFYSSVWKNWWATAAVSVNENIHMEDVNVQEKYLEWDGVDHGIFYREIVPENSKFAVLLLHGARFTSKNWQDIGTLVALSSNEYTVVAVDLPKHGLSTRVKEQLEEDGKIQFLAELIKKLNLDRPVIVAPSMSGSYALPFVMDEKHSKDLRGFIPIAPAAIAKYTGEDLKKLDLPTLIVYGEKDSSFEQYVDRMKEIPGSEVFMMKEASHPCYLDNPKEFHAKVVEFLDKLNKA